MTNKSINYLTYSLPYTTAAWLIAPIAVIQGIYAKYYALPLTIIASIVLFARIFDAISDPLIGYLSDRHYNKSGTRKYHIAIGGILYIVSSYLLYAPILQVNAVYFAICYVVFYLAWTVFEVPHISWASELALTSESKTVIYSFRNIAGYIGLVLFYAIPLLPFFETRDITPETLKVSVTAAGLMMLFFLIVCMKSTPNHAKDLLHKSNKYDKNIIKPNNQSKNLPNTYYKDIVFAATLLTRNKPFLIFLAAYICISGAVGMWLSLIFLYVDAYLNLGEKFSEMFLAAFIVGVFVTPFWCKLAVYIGKKYTWMIATILTVFSYLYTGTLAPGETEINHLIILKVTHTLGFTCIGAISPAILSEIVDYSTWKHGVERSGTFFSVYTFFAKLIAAIASATGLAIAGWYGFDATNTTQSENVSEGLMLSMCWLPVLFSFIGILFIAYIPINEHRHAIIRRHLDRKLPAR